MKFMYEVFECYWNFDLLIKKRKLKVFFDNFENILNYVNTFIGIFNVNTFFISYIYYFFFDYIISKLVYKKTKKNNQ